MLIESHGLAVTLLRKKIKRMNLRVKHSGEVCISAPLKTSLATIHDFLQRQRPWIDIHRQRFLSQNREVSPSLVTGASIPFQGRACILRIHETQEQPHIHLEESLLHVYMPPSTCLRAHEALFHQLLQQWYQEQMQQVLPSLLEKWCALMNVTVHCIRIKPMSSRWGSCHPLKKIITLNLRLIEKPPACLEYVLVHELVHLFERGHNERFYALMGFYLPHWKEIKIQLR